MPEDWKDWEGQVINGEFRLLQYLGGSDRSAVFLTERAQGEPRRAAIKLIPADPANAERQLARWTLAARLSHAHLLRLFEMGRCQLAGLSLLYLVQEYAEENLAQVVPLRPLTPAEADDLLKPALNALAYLHSRGFVHGHLKPSNLMAVQDQLKLSSDALIRMSEPSGGPEKPGPYDPPEAAAGAISPAGDVWSLGMTLVETLTQRLPTCEPPLQADPVLPAAIAEPFLDVARNCLRRDPQRRWTIARIASRLKQPLPVAGKPTAAAPSVARARPTGAPQKQIVTRRYLGVTLAASLTLLVVLAGVWLLRRGPEVQTETPAPSEKPAVQPESKPTSVVPKTSPAIRTGKKGTISAAPSLPSRAAKPPSGDVARGEVLHEVSANVSQSALDTIRGTVRVSVKVHVSEAGHVTEAELDSPGPSRYFAERALEAARHWEFLPPRVEGRYVASEWILRFEFTQTGTRIIPTETTP